MLAINHLVRSQECDWPGTLADRFDAMGAQRREVESLTGTAVSLAAPAELLKQRVDAVAAHSRPLAEEVTGMVDPHRRAVLEAFVEAVDTEGDLVPTVPIPTNASHTADFGSFVPRVAFEEVAGDHDDP